MSTIKVNSIKNAATTNGGIAIDNTGHVQIDGVQLPTAGQLTNRNLIINGDMRIAQRATSVTGSTGVGYRTIDRMRISTNEATNFVYTHEQSTDAPAGFSNSLKVTTTTAATTSGTGSSAFRPIQYKLEGQDLQHLEWGTSGAKSLTLSFWVKGSVTGTYGVTFYREESTARQITRTFTIDTASTWEYKTVTIPGDTTTAVTNDNENRLAIYLTAGAGPDSMTTDSTSWGDYVSTGFHYGVNVNVHGTLNATIQFTGLQLEVGEKATPFEHRSYGDELARCQRYLFRVNGNDDDQTAIAMAHNHTSSQCRAVIHLPVSMRSVNQSVTETGLQALYGNTSTIELSITSLDEGINAVGVICTASSGTPFTVGRANFIRLINSTSNFFQVESEL